jgi:hypothetical protein
MKNAIRALGWATTVLWVLVILFSGTVVYSATQIRMNLKEKPQVTASNNSLKMSIPFSVNNGGLYDISELNITTCVVAENETIISRSTSLVPLIPKASTVNATHDISLGLDDIFAKNLTYMLFNDANLSVDMFVGLTYAYVLPLKISFNTTMPWGAPLYNLTVGDISIVSPNQVNVSLSFENHAFFSLNGTIRLEIVDGFNRLMGSGATDIFVPPEGSYDDVITMLITGDPRGMTEVRLYFDTSVFSCGPVVIAIE